MIRRSALLLFSAAATLAAATAPDTGRVSLLEGVAWAQPLPMSFPRAGAIRIDPLGESERTTIEGSAVVNEGVPWLEGNVRYTIFPRLAATATGRLDTTFEKATGMMGIKLRSLRAGAAWNPWRNDRQGLLVMTEAGLTIPFIHTAGWEISGVARAAKCFRRTAVLAEAAVDIPLSGGGEAGLRGQLGVWSPIGDQFLIGIPLGFITRGGLDPTGGLEFGLRMGEAWTGRVYAVYPLSLGDVVKTAEGRFVAALEWSFR